MSALLMPSLKAEGSLRPDTFWKLRSLGGGSMSLRFWCLKKPGTAVTSGRSPARSAMPGPRDVGVSGPEVIVELGGRA